jgi:3-hydroxybutyryl-CoA dehydrogenase
MSIKTVGVLGCGLMGSGIAQVSAQAGYRTIVREVRDDLLEKGLGRVRKFLNDGWKAGLAEARTRWNLSGRPVRISGCDLVIEAIIENIDEKVSAYAALDALVGPATIFASNTSSLCIMELASKTKRPDRFGGLHFFNPVPLMKLVEVVRALTTSEDTYRELFAFAQSLGKEPITAPDKPGFIVNASSVYLLDASARQHGLGTGGHRQG